MFSETQKAAESAEQGVEDTPAAAPSTPAEPAKPVEGTIPGLEPEKPAEAPVDESEQDVASVADATEAGKYREKNPDGTLSPIPDLKDEVRVGDKESNKDVAGLVRMAYDGVAGQRAVAEKRHLESEVIPRLQQVAQQRINELQAVYEALVELNAAILADATGETWAKNHEKYAAAQSPEEVARRANEQTLALRQQLAEQQAQQYTTQTFATQIKPVLDTVAVECPDVSDHTKAGIIADITKDLLVAGRVPPDRFPTLVARMQSTYVTAVRAEQARFASLKQSTEAELAREKEAAAAALRQAQAKQKALVAGMKPVGGAPTSGDLPLPPPRTRAEALERIVNRPYTG